MADEATRRNPGMKKNGHTFLYALIAAAIIMLIWGLATNWWQTPEKSETLTEHQFTEVFDFDEADWPWTSDTTKVTCKDHNAVVMEIDNVVYPLNGHAKEFDYASADLNDVWLDDPNVEGLKINASDYDSLALGFCGIDSPSLN